MRHGPKGFALGVAQVVALVDSGMAAAAQACAVDVAGLDALALAMLCPVAVCSTHGAVFTATVLAGDAAIGDHQARAAHIGELWSCGHSFVLRPDDAVISESVFPLAIR